MITLEDAKPSRNNCNACPNREPESLVQINIGINNNSSIALVLCNKCLLDLVNKCDRYCFDKITKGAINE